MNKTLNRQSIFFLGFLVLLLAWQFSPAWLPAPQTVPSSQPPTPIVQPVKAVQTSSLTILKPFHVCPRLLKADFNPVQLMWLLEFSDVPARWVALRFQNASSESSIPFSRLVTFPTQQSVGSWVLRVDSCDEIILNR